MESLQQLIAKKLLEINAIKLQPDNPFTWGSGWDAPIYTDNRTALSYPRLRSALKTEMARLVIEQFGDAEVVAGVATSAIAQGALVADSLGLPFIYVRTTPKDHGLENLIEGRIEPGQKVVIIEDQISTGQNSLKVAEALMLAGAEVLGMIAVFDYGFPDSRDRFRQAGISLSALTNFDAMLEVALRDGYIAPKSVTTLRHWHSDPGHWIPARDACLD